MGKSTSSCLKIITCGGGVSADGEDLTSAVSKASSDKPRWSFRKKSAGHQVLSNNLISEPASVGYNKENPEATTNDFNSPKKLSIPEKASIEEPSLSSAIVTPVTVVDPSIIGRNDIITDHNLEDSVAVVIQAAIRRYLAQRELRKLQNVIKLQAAVRGHLVRRQAVGTLRCIQAIVKMQALVRARQGNVTSCTEPNKACTATEKLLSNRFACQLLESTPKTKRIHIKCDPSISDSSWKWLERWMAITSSVTEKQLEQNLFQAYQVQEGNSKLVAYEAANEVPVAVVSVSSDSKSNPSESAVPTEGEGNSITKTSAEFQAPVSVPKDRFTSLERNDQDQRQLENEALGMAPEDDTNTDRIIEKTSASLSGQIPLLSNTTSQPVFSCEPLENEGKKFVLGSRKSCNPAFAAVQSKFEELSSTTIVSRSINPACQDALDESKYDRPNYQVDSLTKIKDLSLMENSLIHDPRNQIAASECGTEISISSTLDSPDRSEAEGGEIVLEIEALGKGNPVFDGGADNDFNHPSMKATAKSASSVSEVLQSQRVEDSNGNVGNPVAAADAQQVEQQSEEPITSHMKNQIENLVVPQVYRSSPEGTPRSHTTAPEAHETPSSQVSVNAKKSKKDINLPAGKQITQIVVKRSPSNPNNGSGGRSSTEHLPKDSKTAKRRSSFGTAKPDHLDHEPRVSNSNSLPSYMQATESAKAKALAGISPKSSPDVHDKDNYTKKRHSLPIGNGKQELSPRMQRSSSQAQQNLKGNATHSPHNSAGTGGPIV